MAVNFHTTIYYPISSFLNFTPFCWGGHLSKKLLPVCYTRWAIRKTNPFVNRSINGNEINFGKFWPPKLWGALAPLIYVIEYYCWTCSMKIFNGNILSIYDFSIPWQICGPPPKNQFLGSLRGVAFLGASNKKIGFRGTYQQLNQTKKIRKKIPIIFWDIGPRRGKK